MESRTKDGISALTLEELFPETLTNTNCIFVDKEREIWLATEMCAQYLESSIDALVVQDNDQPIGIVGGYDILDHLRKNPSRDYQYQHKIHEIMFRNLPQVSKQTKFGNLMENWKNSRRAFTVIQNESGSFSPITARKMLELGKKSKTDLLISSLPKKNMITFEGDEQLGSIIELMFDNKTRKLLLKNSNQYISDRTILEGLSRVIKFQSDVDNLLEIPINKFSFDHINEITEDLQFDKLCSIMDKMEHPYVIYKDIAISPWDVCLTLITEDIQISEIQPKVIKTCPHCGKSLN